MYNHPRQNTNTPRRKESGCVQQTRDLQRNVMTTSIERRSTEYIPEIPTAPVE